MDRPYELSFTQAFWHAVDELGLCRSDVMARSMGLIENPYVGRTITDTNGSIYVWDISIKGKGNFRWYYIFDEEAEVIVSVFVVSNPQPSQNRGDDVVLGARLVEIALRILAGG